MKLSALSAALGLELERDGDFETLGLVSAETPRMIAFLESEEYLAGLNANPQVSCVITQRSLATRVGAALGLALSDDPRRTFYRLHHHLATQTSFYGESFPTVIAPSARVHPRAYVAEKNVRIGERCLVEPNATILERSVLADDVIVRAGAVIGSEGFQFAAVGAELLAVVHAGGVRLERGAEVQSNTCVDRALFGSFTVVGEQTKIDNLVHIAHNVHLGRRNRVVAGAMVAGSVRTGDDVWIGPMASISHELRIGDHATVTMGAVVTRDVPASGRVSGNFALDHAKFVAFMRTIR